MMTGDDIVRLSRKHTIYEWSVQCKVDPIPVARAEGVYFWTPEEKRFLDFNSQLMCCNLGHGHPEVVKAIQDQAAVLAYANPFMATEGRARLGEKLAAIPPETCPHELEDVIRYEGGHNIAAFIMEPVVGTNGILIPPDGYMRAVRDICDHHGILLIAAEVMSGFGRTGRWVSVHPRHV